MKPTLVPVIFLACVMAACTAKQGAEDEAVLGVIRENVKSMEREDIKGVMATMHPNMPDLEDLRKEDEKIFARYDLSYELRELKVVSITKDEAKVSFVQRIHRVAGETDLPEYLTVEGVHTLKKDGDKWKLFNTENNRYTPE